MNKKNTLYKIELKKAICNRGFLVAIIIGIALTVLSLIYQVNMFNNEKDKLNAYLETVEVTYNPDVTGNILFNKWIGAEGGSLGTIVYFFVFSIGLCYLWITCVSLHDCFDCYQAKICCYGRANASVSWN